MLKRNGSISITIKKVSGTWDLVSTTYANLVEDVKRDETLLLADGLIKLKVVSKTKDTVACKVINGGVLRENTGINLPGCKVSAPCLTQKDKKDLEFGIESAVDYFAFSFVRSADDLNLLKSILKKKRSDIPVIAKIEKREAVDNFNQILEIADGIMVARGDLGAELRLEQVPTVQKLIIDKAVRANKPVITATQMLETMCDNPVPTRAEVSDVANAIFDGTDGIMLSGETATGKYPVEAVKMMTRIAAEAEGSAFMKYNIEHDRSPEELVAHAAAQSAVNVLHEVDGKAIMSFSVSGKTAKLISKQRPCKPVYAFTPSIKVYHRMAMLWGVIPVCIPETDDTRCLITTSENLLVGKKLIKRNDIVIIVIGLGLTTGSTNMVKIHRVGRDD
jgi:pyruvate kinase